MKLQEKVLGGIAELVIRRHKVIVVIGAILAVLSVAAMSRIQIKTQIKTQIKDMVSADNPKVKSFDEMTDRFTGSSAVIVLVEGPDKTAMIAAAEELGERIRGSPEAMRYVRNIDLKSDMDFFADWSLLMRKPRDIETSAMM
jgi:predicted RND superfamily exporter protein